jgi:hypothetical protein
MKKALVFITVLSTVMSCRKQEVLVPGNEQQASVQKQPETCTFGITQFNLVKRAPVGQTDRRSTGTQTTSGGSVILLDFDGATVSNTSWNVNGTFTCSPANLTSENISEIVDRVTNDYSPFNITITTSETVYNAANVYKRTRVIITESNQWYGNGAGGTSYVGSLTWGDNTPCFVFSTLLNYNVKKIAEACSHEAAHTIGLYHQAVYDNTCTKISDYNPGQGTGENGWAPIMGIAYAQNATLWHNGPNSNGCSSYQNELTIISNAVGGFKPDDYSNTSAGAASLTTSLAGMINSTGDIDFFYLNTSTTKNISAIPFSVGANNSGANVNLLLNVYNSSGNLIATVDDPLSLGVSTTLNPGQYYLSVTTAANEYAGIYGMLGKYTIAAN